MTAIKSLHTLNARNNVMLEVMRDYFNLGPRQMFRVIQEMRYSVEEVLGKKGIKYDNLRSALVPAQDRREIALVFDTTAIDADLYGLEVMKQVIPLFDENGNHSVLLGNCLEPSSYKEELVEAFRQAVELRCGVHFQHPTQFFIVYINNLTKHMVECFDNNLSQYCGYAGLVDMTYGSMFKFYLSTILANSFIKHGKIILQGHEPDRDAKDDVNMSGYPFEESGYACRSISNDLMGVLLSYKIERPVYQGFEVDTEFALNAVVDAPVNISEFEFEVKEKKLEYIIKRKLGPRKRANLEDISSEQLSALIKAKIQKNYIYDLCFNAEYNIIKFNVILELPARGDPPAIRLLATLGYQPNRKKLRLITSF